MAESHAVVHVEDIQTCIVLLEVNLSVVGVSVSAVGFDDGEDTFDVCVLDLEEVLGDVADLGISRDGYGTG